MLTQQQIIALAVEADLAEVDDTAESLPAYYVESLAKLANLAYQRGVRDEREACLVIIEDTDVEQYTYCQVLHDDGRATLASAAAAIRSRSTKENQ